MALITSMICSILMLCRCIMCRRIINEPLTAVRTIAKANVLFRKKTTALSVERLVFTIKPRCHQNPGISSVAVKCQIRNVINFSLTFIILTFPVLPLISIHETNMVEIKKKKKRFPCQRRLLKSSIGSWISTMTQVWSFCRLGNIDKLQSSHDLQHSSLR